MTRLVMLGAGSLGGLFAHHLSMGGADVCIVDLWAEHVDAIRAGGLQVKVGETMLPPAVHQATTQVDEAGSADILMVFVKTHATREALRSARRVVRPDTVIVTLQNGLDNSKVVHEIYPRQTVLYGLTTLTSDLLAPGLIAARSTESGVTDVWTTDPAHPKTVADFVELLCRGGIHARVAPDIDLSIWKKLVVNCALNGLCAITDLTCGQLCAQPEVWPLLDRIADETAALARARGVALASETARVFLREVAQASAEHYPSMVFDLRKKRRTEIDGFNNAIVQGSAALGLDASANQSVVALIKSIEANFATVRH